MLLLGDEQSVSADRLKDLYVNWIAWLPQADGHACLSGPLSVCLHWMGPSK